MALAGTLCGQLLFGCLGDFLGRKKVYLYTLLLMIFATVAQALSSSTVKGVHRGFPHSPHPAAPTLPVDDPVLSPPLLHRSRHLHRALLCAAGIGVVAILAFWRFCLVIPPPPPPPHSSPHPSPTAHPHVHPPPHTHLRTPHPPAHHHAGHRHRRRLPALCHHHERVCQ